MSEPWRPETLAVALGRPHGPGAPLNVPPHFASAFLDGGETLYGRYGNPSYAALEEAVGALEGGSAVAFSTGMAAVAAVLDEVPLGGRVVLGQDAYQGTRALLGDLDASGRTSVDPVDPADLDAVRAALPGASLLWVESPSNPLLAVADLAALTALAREAGVPTVVDNTFATPLLQNPLALGADVVVHSATKFIGGHSDLMLGLAVTADGARLEGLRHRRVVYGAAPSAMDVFLALRGLRTLPVRVRTAQESAGTLAERLAAHPAVAAVHYPGLPDHPGHDVAARQMRGYGAMLSFRAASEEAADRVLGRLRLVTMATRLGGVETLAERRNRWPSEQAPTGLVRVSVGLEHVEDLWADLGGALDAET